MIKLNERLNSIENKFVLSYQGFVKNLNEGVSHIVLLADLYRVSLRFQEEKVSSYVINTYIDEKYKSYYDIKKSLGICNDRVRLGSTLFSLNKKCDYEDIISDLLLSYLEKELVDEDITNEINKIDVVFDLVTSIKNSTVFFQSIKVLSVQDIKIGKCSNKNRKYFHKEEEC